MLIMNNKEKDKKPIFNRAGRGLAAFFLAATCTQVALAGDIRIDHFRYSGPFVLRMPVMVDSVGVAKDSFKVERLIDTPVDLSKAGNGSLYAGTLAPTSKEAPALHLLQFSITNSRYAKAKVKVGNLKTYQLFVDGEKSNGDLSLTPATHNVVVKYISTPADNDSLRVTVSSDADSLLSIDSGTQRSLSLTDFLNGKHHYGNSVSADGRYDIAASYQTTAPGKTAWTFNVYDLKQNTIVRSYPTSIQWKPGTDDLLYERQGTRGKQLICASLTTGAETVLAEALPEGNWTMSPDGTYLIISQSQEGPKDDNQVHQIIEPDDRQPGWRSRNRLLRYDLQTGVAQPLTFGYHDVNLYDISQDSRYILYGVSRSRLQKRPTTLASIYRLDLSTMKSETLVDSDGFISDACFSPDGSTIAVKGSPESFGGIGENLPEGRTPSMYDYQLYLLDCATKKVTPMTRFFNPSIESVEWNRNDGKIYFNALDRDYRRLYRLDPKTGKIEQLNVKEDCVGSLSFADKAPVICYSGQSATNASRLYSMNINSGKSLLLDDCQKALSGVDIAECREWNFQSNRGDTIYGRYYLPPHFNAEKKYPMIVYYYGGCSPTSRNFDGNYPFPLYAAMGYVVYVVQPSGAAGFGQEFASRHVNTAGEGVADDIIEGTKKFCADHGFIDSRHVGCLGASYGGFMTEYLQTKTDIFAAAVAHAGISDHTAYWGEGYWGYSYSEVSMANRYPWTDKELYVDHSPLYNADKIHTPLLLVHGTADTNVPTGNSIALYTALRLLGRPVALVEVEGENHWIQDYNKRIKWQNTIFAWFAKWLQGDDSWWKALYDKMPE